MLGPYFFGRAALISGTHSGSNASGMKRLFAKSTARSVALIVTVVLGMTLLLLLFPVSKLGPTLVDLIHAPFFPCSYSPSLFVTLFALSRVVLRHLIFPA